MVSHRRNKSSSVSLQRNIVPTLSVDRVGFGLFFLSAASLAFEVTLTHLYSITFQYHYAFLAVSLAILGLGIGAMIGYRLPEHTFHQPQKWISRTAAVFAISMPLVVILFSLTGFLPGFVLQTVLGAIPFTFMGLFTSRMYTLFHQNANRLYAYDLGGAVFGLIVVLGLLTVMSAASVGFALGILAAISAWILIPAQKSELLVNLSISLIILVGIIINLIFHFVDLPRLEVGSIPPDKTMFQILADPSGTGRLVDSAWSNFARVDLVAGNNPSEMYVFTNAGAGSYMERFDGDLSKVNWLTEQVEYLPFINFTPDKTIILGAGAGKDVLQALLAGSQHIIAVEINPAMVSITRKHADFNGGILDYPGVTTVVADGRDFISRSSEVYNMIYLNLVYAQAPTPGSSALSEAYLFTTQAFQIYWQHLSPSGRLAIVSHQGLEGTRALISAIQALNFEGMTAGSVLKHAALLMYQAQDPNQNISVMILQKSPLNEQEVATLYQAGKIEGMQPLFLPGIYETLFRGLTTDEITLDQFLVQKDYNLFPTHDESPFFFNLTPGLPHPLVVLLILSGIVFLGYLIFIVGSRNHPSFWQLLFFGGLGLGYILIEVPLIQRTILLVGNPTLAMVIILATLLLSSGISSLYTARWKTISLWPRIALAALIVAILSVLLAMFQPGWQAGLGQLALVPRVLLSIISVIPIGLAMGIPFANGLRLAGSLDEKILPYLWGFNAVTSVAGSAIAASLAIQYRFATVMVAGGFCYLIVALAAYLSIKRG